MRKPLLYFAILSFSKKLAIFKLSFTEVYYKHLIKMIWTLADFASLKFFFANPALSIMQAKMQIARTHNLGLSAAIKAS